jgi:hypothetical protein
MTKKKSIMLMLSEGDSVNCLPNIMIALGLEGDRERPKAKKRTMMNPIAA